MLVGTASLAELSQAAPTIPAFHPDAIALQGVACFQMTAEMHNQAREPVLPPSLHPTVPAALSLQAWDVTESPWGAFRMVVARVTCRSGVRARGFVTAATVNNQAATEALTSTFGFPASYRSDIHFQRSYAGASIRVVDNGETLLDINAIDPEPMGLDDVQYTGSLTLSHTPNGLRLVQVETNHTLRRVERLSATLRSFSSPAWGNPLLDPYRVVSASLTEGDVTLPALRFVCKPDELAFTGTEAI